MTNAYLEGYQPRDAINVSGGEKSREIIAPLFAKPKEGGVESGLSRAWKKY